MKAVVGVGGEGCIGTYYSTLIEAIEVRWTVCVEGVIVVGTKEDRGRYKVRLTARA